MGAFLSCTHKINLFEISIDKSNCINCNRCITSCPNFAITEESLSKGKALIVDSASSDVVNGTKLELVIRKLDDEGKNGLIIYGPAYRPAFRTAPNSSNGAKNKATA